MRSTYFFLLRAIKVKQQTFGKDEKTGKNIKIKTTCFYFWIISLDLEISLIINNPSPRLF